MEKAIQIRIAEEEIATNFKEKKIFSFLHLYIGEEAIAVGAISGAYSTEVIRGAFLAIPKGQIESAKSVGMNKFLIFRFPQGFRPAVACLQ